MSTSCKLLQVGFAPLRASAAATALATLQKKRRHRRSHQPAGVKISNEELYEYELQGATRHMYGVLGSAPTFAPTAQEKEHQRLRQRCSSCPAGVYVFTHANVCRRIQKPKMNKHMFT